jgi:hypothetical protein
MIDILIATAAASSAIGALITRALLGPRRRRVKYPCPWDPCGYPLPETPLIDRMEDNKNYASYAPEECQGCGKTVRWCRFTEAYVRFKTV